MTYMETTKMTMAGDAAEHFGGEMKDAIISNIPEIIALALVTAVFSLVLFVYLKPAKKSPVLCGTALVVCVVLHLFCRFALSAGGSGQYSPSEMYRQYPRILDNNVENFGVLTSLRLELCDMVFGHASENKPGFETLDPDILTPSTKPNPEVTEPIHGDETQSGDNTTYIPPEPVKLKNVLDIDMESLIAQETDSKLLSIHEYVASQSGSYTNEYTGMFEGYNLIMICAESFTSHMISEELTPTLYKMSTNGFVFNNYYGTFKSVTTNGEYAFCTGLMPNTVGKVDDLKKNSTFLVPPINICLIAWAMCLLRSALLLSHITAIPVPIISAVLHIRTWVIVSAVSLMEATWTGYSQKKASLSFRPEESPEL